MSIRISVAQLDFVVGDVSGNAQRILDAARQAHAAGAQLLLTPELSLPGYAAEDLYLRPQFLTACDDALNWLVAQTASLKNLAIVVGHPWRVSGEGLRTHSVALPACYNAASVLRNGRIEQTYAKQCLPNYQVFDERRYFIPGTEVGLFDVAGTTVGLLICEDAWFEAPAKAAVEAGADVLAVINASPFHLGKSQQREAAMGARARACARPLVYAHLVGGQDEVVFEGRSFMTDAQGQVVARAAGFEEAVITWDVAQAIVNTPTAEILRPLDDEMSDLWQTLVMGVRDYVQKNGFPSVLLGLSGGIDSAVVMAVAVDALGADRVRAVMMPSPYTADISWIDARDMAARLKVRYDEIDIGPHFETFKSSLAADFKGLAADTTEENLQARIRGTLLMALSNKFGSIVLTTGNKSEMATGYCTLYGDMAGGYAVIKDVFKTKVFAVANWRNENNPFGGVDNPIPSRIITRPPSAELREDQKDEDSLPAYPVLDAILARYIEEDQSAAEIIEAGFDAAAVNQVLRLVRLNEYKRRQSPVGIRLTHRGFGKDWRYPITNAFR